MLKEYFLENEVLEKHFREHLTGLNELSKSVLKYMDFSKGRFYTIFEEGVEEARLYKLSMGYVKGDIQAYLTQKVCEYFSIKRKGVCIFDDFIQKYKDGENWYLYNQIGVHCEREMLYVVQPEEVKKELILECFQTSNVQWHSLVVLSDFPYRRNEEQSISKEDMQDIVKQAKYVFLLAYDAEGYLVWERDESIK